MEDENFVSFGEEGALLTYGSYLRLPQLLDAQHLESDPPAHDELLFITIHQVYELWFQQLLHEVEAVRDALLDTENGSRSWWARHLMNRVHVIERVLVHQIDVLETMTPQDFLEFRQRLAPASGFQSVQFRELEFISGAKDAGYVNRFKGLTEHEKQRLRRRLDEPSLWDAFTGLLAARGLDTSSDRGSDGVAAPGGPRPADLRRPVGAGGGTDPARRAGRRLAGPARRDGRADDRLQDGHGRVDRVELSAGPARAQVLPTALGPALRPLRASGALLAFETECPTWDVVADRVQA